MADRDRVMGGLAALAIFLGNMGDPISDEQAGICADALALLKEQEQTPGEWVSVKDRLPEKQGEYIAFDGKSVFGAYYEGTTLDTMWTDTTEGYRDYVVTHWMPLPKPPKEDEDD